MDIKCKIEFFPDQFGEIDDICDRLISEGWVLSKLNEHKVITRGVSRIVTKVVIFERHL